MDKIKSRSVTIQIWDDVDKPDESQKLKINDYGFRLFLDYKMNKTSNAYFQINTLADVNLFIMYALVFYATILYAALS
jgi:hypothetical protein